MGDANSWLIFLIGWFAVTMFGIALLVALIAGAVVLLRRRSAKNATQLQQDSNPDNVSSGQASAGQAAYNIVSDTVIGLNIRKSDNRFQAIFILVTVLLLAAVGAVAALLNAEWSLPWFGGALIGAFAGLIIGVLASGIFLMFYRAIRHLQGRHE